MANERASAGTDTKDPRAMLSAGRGVDNRSHETRIDDGFVRVADNVDIDAHGIVRRRAGYPPAALAALVGAHSLWAHPSLAFALVADGSTLYRLDASGTLAPVVAGIAGTDVSYALVGNRVRWSNGVETGQLDLTGLPAPLGAPTPAPSFQLVASPNGGMHAGTYGVTLTFLTAAGEEGGAPPTAFVEVVEGGGIVVNAVPNAPGVAVARAYVTDANGTDLFEAGTCTPGGTLLLGAGTRGKPLATQFLDPFPPADYLLGKAGRLFGATGRYVVWSQAMYYGLWRPTHNRAAMPDQVTMLAAPDIDRTLLYVGTRSKTYRLEGESIDTAMLSIVGSAGVVPGSMMMLPPEALRLDNVLSSVPVWVGTDGVPYAGTTLGIVPLSQKFAFPIYDRAATGFVQQDGQSRYIVSGRGGRTSGLTMQDHVIATVIQAGP